MELASRFNAQMTNQSLMVANVSLNINNVKSDTHPKGALPWIAFTVILGMSTKMGFV